MKVSIVEDPRQVMVMDGYTDSRTGQWVEGECRILREDVEDAKAFAKELMKEDNPRIRQQWEHDYYKQIKEMYSAQVAGAMLKKIWDWTPVQGPEEEKDGWTNKDITAIAEKIKGRMS